MYDILTEKKRGYYCYVYLLDEKKWNNARITNSVALGLMGAGASFVMGKLPIVNSLLIGLIVGLLIFKLTYFQLTKLDIAIGKHLQREFPSFAITLASLLTTYENITNAFEKAYEYNDDMYYKHLLLQVVEANKRFPDQIDKNIFDFCEEIPSSNAMFLAKTLADFREKGYDEQLIDKLIANLNVENTNITKTIVDSATDKFIKFGTAPIMLSIGMLFIFVFAMMSLLPTL